jgi:aspartyl-tRNA(Asn)/glutamyl-tRNA(Gln) amidotransferase subunit A
MLTASIAQLSEALRTRRVSCVELTRGLLDRIETLGAQLNAFITVDRAGALRQAEARSPAFPSPTRTC